MGVEFHITRAEFWADNEDSQIASEEWLNIVNHDPELSIYAPNGEFFALWSGKSAYPEPWLEWNNGNISTKWPDTALYLKMLQVATVLNAKVMDEDGTEYSSPSEWEFTPES
ncbi:MULTISPECIES: hypothetical protein [Rahnella]|uniref:hypothetical protein n=1 Tax=Rahnella TaxID=34037 RepID=UPI003F6E2A33